MKSVELKQGESPNSKRRNFIYKKDKDEIVYSLWRYKVGKDEKEYFRQINLLVSAGYTVVFIAHEQIDSQTKYITPKGDKRCMNPIIDKCDYVVYLKSNGVDSKGNIIKSSGYLAQTNEFFARARIEYTPTFLPEFTAESLAEAIQEGINKKRDIDGATVTTFSEQQKLNTVEKLDYNNIMTEFKNLISSIPGNSDPSCSTPEGQKFKEYYAPRIVQITEKYLGKGKRVHQCNENQVEALSLIVMDLKAFLDNENI